MKSTILVCCVLAVTAAGAQTTSQSQVRHVETSLNHLTVLEFAEPVTTIAVADTDSFQVERHDDKIFVKPLREGVATNLFVWTASRELSYELDPAGQLASMDVLIRTEPAVHPHAGSANEEAVVANAELHRAPSEVLAEAMLGAENIVDDSHKESSDRISVVFNQVYRAKDQLYLRYTVTNGTKSPWRLTTPDIDTPLTSQQPVSIVGLRDHQLTSEMFASFKTKPGPSVVINQADVINKDLSPGQKASGVISIRYGSGSAPQLFQFSFGSDGKNPLVVAAVL